MLLKEAERLSVDDDLLQGLGEVVENAQVWERRASEMLSTKKGAHNISLPFLLLSVLCMLSTHELFLHCNCTEEEEGKKTLLLMHMDGLIDILELGAVFLAKLAIFRESQCASW